MFKDLDEYRIKQEEETLKILLPQLIINPFIVSVWSLYENVIRDFSEILRKDENISKNLYEADGKYFIAKLKNYFSKDLKKSLYLTEEQLQNFRWLSDIRNSIVHHYGKMSSLREPLQNQIINNQIVGIRKAPKSDKIILSYEFAESMFESVRDHLLT